MLFYRSGNLRALNSDSLPDSPIPYSCCFDSICLSYMSHALSSPVSEFQFDPGSPSSFPVPLHSFLHVFRSKDTCIKPSSSGQPSCYHKTEYLFDLILLRFFFFFLRAFSFDRGCTANQRDNSQSLGVCQGGRHCK